MLYTKFNDIWVSKKNFKVFTMHDSHLVHMDINLDLWCLYILKVSHTSMNVLINLGSSTVLLPRILLSKIFFPNIKCLVGNKFDISIKKLEGQLWDNIFNKLGRTPVPDFNDIQRRRLFKVFFTIFEHSTSALYSQQSWCCQTAPVDLGSEQQFQIGWAIIWHEEKNKMTGTTLF